MTLNLFAQLHKTRNGRGAGMEIGLIFDPGLKFAEQGIVDADAPQDEDYTMRQDPF